MEPENMEHIFAAEVIPGFGTLPLIISINICTLLCVSRVKKQDISSAWLEDGEHLQAEGPSQRKKKRKWPIK
jgi:hypothetical protein